MRLRSLAFSALVSLVSIAAKADTVTSTPVNGSGEAVSGSGTLYATSNAGGSYTITSIDVPGVTGLVSTGDFHGNDNLLFPNASPALDGQGLAFTDQQTDGAYEVDLYSDSQTSTGYSAYVTDSDGYNLTVPVTFSLEPAAPTVSPMLHAAILAAATTPTAFRFTYAVVQPGSGAAITPEPSSIALLGTGLLGLAGVVRKRFA